MTSEKSKIWEDLWSVQAHSSIYYMHKAYDNSSQDSNEMN